MEQKSDNDIAVDQVQCNDNGIVEAGAGSKLSSKPCTKLNLKMINKFVSSRRKKQKRKSISIPIKPSIATITPSVHQNFQTWNIHVIPSASNPSISDKNISKNTQIQIGIYELPSIKSFGCEYKFAPYYFYGYGFYGNAYDKNSRECNRSPLKQVVKTINIYDKLAISLNQAKNEIIIWRNGTMDSNENVISIDRTKEYQFIIEMKDNYNYQIKVE